MKQVHKKNRWTELNSFGVVELNNNSRERDYFTHTRTI